MKPLCLVLMPFGRKTDGTHKEIDFDKVYETFIRPAILAAGLEPIRTDEEQSGGFIHKPTYERLLFSQFAVADLSLATANVFYELGIRHAVRRNTTVTIFESGTRLPFDVAPLRAMPYDFVEGAVSQVEQKIKALADLIQTSLHAQRTQDDSPIAQLITKYKFPELDYLQQDAEAFRELVNKTEVTRKELKALVNQWQAYEKEKNTAGKQEVLDKIKRMEADAADELGHNFDLLYAFLDAYKSISAFQEVITLLKPKVDTTARGNQYLQQQLALAYNKTRQREKAETILTEIIDQCGPDSETNGLLGAVYKSLMDDHQADELIYQHYCSQAIRAYLDGFEADPRDYYPGVNALMLMYFEEGTDERFRKFLPLVSYAVERQLSIKKKDYWVQATALELAVLETDEAKVRHYLASAQFCKPAKWMKEITASSLERIYRKALQTGKENELKWLPEMIQKLA
jgi:hypothetical protein